MIPFITKSILQVKRLVILVVGFSVLFAGVALLILPGPAFIVIPLGLGILASELLWARNLLKRIKKPFQRNKETNHASKTE
jgi:tellurite resistance protein TerC